MSNTTLPLQRIETFFLTGFEWSENSRAYNSKEADKAAHLIQDMFKRKQGADSNSELMEIIKDLNWYIENYYWVLCGNYGAEYMYFFERIMNGLKGKSNKALIRSLRSIAYWVFDTLVLIENPDINRTTLKRLVKVLTVEQKELIVTQLINYLDNNFCINS